MWVSCYANKQTAFQYLKLKLKEMLAHRSGKLCQLVLRNEKELKIKKVNVMTSTEKD